MFVDDYYFSVSSCADIRPKYYAEISQRIIDIKGRTCQAQVIISYFIYLFSINPSCFQDLMAFERTEKTKT